MKLRVKNDVPIISIFEKNVKFSAAYFLIRAIKSKKFKGRLFKQFCLVSRYI